MTAAAECPLTKNGESLPLSGTECVSAVVIGRWYTRARGGGWIVRILAQFSQSSPYFAVRG
jgi:hypothetical protein